MKNLIPDVYKKYYVEGKENIDTFCKVYISPAPDDLVIPTEQQKSFVDRANSGDFQELWMAGGNSCQPINLTKILMESGEFKLLKDLKVGERVIAPDETGCGESAKVVAIQDRGLKEVFKLTFSDGGYVYGTKEHKFPSYRRCHGMSGFKKRRLEEFRTDVFPAHRDSLQRGFIEYNKKELPVDPYFMGVLLGDGGLTIGVSVTTVDKEILEAIYIAAKNNDCHVTRHKHDKIIYQISTKLGLKNKLIDKLKKIGIHGHKSLDKFIPTIYKQSSYEQRMQLLAGLIDTDGSYSKKTIYEFCSSSERLSSDVEWLCKSLGMHAKKSSRIVDSNFGRFKSYRVYISSNEIIPCRIKRKKGEVTEYRPRDVRKRILRKIESVGYHETVDITVDHPNHCYISDDWVVTGNSGKTFCLKFLATQWAVYKIKPSKKYKNAEDYRRSEYNILCTGPEQKQAMELWEKIEDSFRLSPFLRHKVKSVTTGTRRNTHPVITLKNGVNIEAIGLQDKGKHIEGQAYDLILINEPADARHLMEIFEKVLQPRTWRRGGAIIGVGTPKGKGDFYHLWKKGQLMVGGQKNPDFDEKVYSCYVDSRDNPYADQESISRYLTTQNEAIISERIEGKFTDSDQLAFPDSQIESILDETLSEKIGYSSMREYIHGVDFGRKEDYTVCMTFDMTEEPYTLVNYYRKGGGVGTWEEIFNDLLNIYQEYQGDFVCDATAMGGDMQMEWLDDMGIPSIPFQYGGSAGKKISLINNLQRFISEKKIRLSVHYTIISELHGYPRDLNDKGLETDSVMALALACWGIKDYRINNIIEPYKR